MMLEKGLCGKIALRRAGQVSGAASEVEVEELRDQKTTR